MVGGFLVVTVILFLLCWRWQRRHLIRMGRELGSGVLALPFIGHSYLFIGGSQTRMETLQTLGRDAIRIGGLSSFWHGTKLFAVVADPVVAELVLKTCLEKDDIMGLATILIGNGSIYAPGLEILQVIEMEDEKEVKKSWSNFDQYFMPFGCIPDTDANTKVLFWTSETPCIFRIWRRRRKIVSPAYGMRNLRHFASIFAKQSAVLATQMRAAVGVGSFPVWGYFTRYTMDSIAEATLAFDLKAQTSTHQPFLEAFDNGLAKTAARVCQPWLHNDALYKRMSIYHEQIRQRDYVWSIVTKLIQTKRKELKETHNETPESNISDTPKEGLNTFLELLLRSNEALTDLEVLEEIMVISIAGNDTSAVGSAFAMLMLARHQDVQEMIYQELQEVFGDSDRPVCMEDLSRLRQLDAALRETLRLYPPVPVITRKVDRELKLPSGVTLVPGSGVLVSLWALHRDPRHWGPDAELFRPDRFLTTNKHPAFMPFSHGPRNCLGYQFAMMSMKTALSSLLRQYQVLPAQQPSPLSDHPPIKLKFDLMMKDVDDFQVQIVLRNKSEKY